MIGITKIIRQMKQGQTGPFLCEADDGHKYIVKGARATGKGLVKEWLVGHLCRGFGLPIPDFKLAYVDNVLVEFDYDDLGAGVCFASQYIDNIQDITVAQRKRIDKQLLRDLFVFDYWIRNDDRNLTALGGNPNLFIHPQTNRVYVLDHNLSFEPDFDLDTFNQCHIGAEAWNEKIDFLDNQFYEERFKASLATLKEAIEQLPDEWLEVFDLDSIEAQIKVVLLHYTHTGFWEGIQ
ncbi:hypothetical protein HWQ46_25560 [Shewanella sp. D64]|uniref:HipA family kinase n=1 Tax=unclassified Shewanella TaxID=196818 RepID=UPI0022BA2E29|nr:MULTISPECIES: HipA family kinase [unclassified Shewanella]MEC4728886.1 hypothetical protein [Shewanella sp. D64]MEC4740760.1 hypothetical protein [Shewanella sp. E94]WBJ94498.1 hypothetical protein HWQ47_21955 [Shewanella sp. MTB7]